MANYAQFENLLVSIDQRVATLTLNRPHALNAVTHAMHDELADAFRDLSRDTSVNAIIVTGAGRGFCSGFDQKASHDPDNPAPEMPPEKVGQVTKAILSTPQPIIAAVNGPAVGQGSQIALFCDVVIASDRALIGDVHVKAGVAPGDGGVAIYPLLLGLNKAKDMLMTAAMISGEEAYRLGLVQRLVPHDQLIKEAMLLARKFADGPQLAIRWTKQALNKFAWERVIKTLDYTATMELLSGKHPDREEASRAFAAKRPPSYE